MALGAKPKLTEIKTELGSSNNALSDFIIEAGQTGVWDRQSDFASYTHGTFTMSPNLLFDSTGAPFQIVTVTSSGAWTITAYEAWIIPDKLTGTGNDTIRVTCSVNAGGFRSGNMAGELDSNPLINDSVGISQSEP